MSQENLTHAARPHSLNDTRLFAALVTLGIQPAEGPQIYIGETRDGTPKQTWYLERTSICGRYQTNEMIAAWNDPKWHEANPEHPLAYIKCAFMNMVSFSEIRRRRVSGTDSLRARVEITTRSSASKS